MRKLLFLAAIICLAQFACKKPNASTRSAFSRPTSTPLDGSWRMILVTDNASGLTTTKPATIPNDVDITFTSIAPTNGTFTGVTPTNQIWVSDYSTGTGETLSIPSMAMTKAGETSWGHLFVGNIRSSVDYTLATTDILNIRTAAKILTFRKLP